MGVECDYCVARNGGKCQYLLVTSRLRVAEKDSAFENLESRYILWLPSGLLCGVLVAFQMVIRMMSFGVALLAF